MSKKPVKKKAQATTISEYAELYKAMQDGLLPLRSIARLFDLKESSIRSHGFSVVQKAKLGALYDGAAVGDFLRDREKKKVEKNRGKEAVEAAEIRKANAQAEAAEIKAATYRKDFVSSRKVDEVWNDVTAIYRQTLIQSAKRLMARLRNTKTDKEFLRAWREWAEETLEETKVSTRRYLSGFAIDYGDFSPDSEDDGDSVGRKKPIPND